MVLKFKQPISNTTYQTTKGRKKEKPDFPNRSRERNDRCEQQTHKLMGDDIVFRQWRTGDDNVSRQQRRQHREAMTLTTWRQQLARVSTNRKYKGCME